MVIILQVIDINNELIDKIRSFLTSINSLSEIDEELIPNGVAIMDTNEVKGYITYEKFCEYGLIRYFIFQKVLPFNLIKDMFLLLSQKAIANEIESLISIGKSKEVIELFNELAFYQIDSSNFLINGQNLKGTELEDALILRYDLNKDITINN